MLLLNNCTFLLFVCYNGFSTLHTLDFGEYTAFLFNGVMIPHDVLMCFVVAGSLEQPNSLSTAVYTPDSHDHDHHIQMSKHYRQSYM
jgi:hypothetical protein